MNAFICILTDQDGNQWLVQLDLDYYTSIGKYSDICGHSLCILCEYQGYSGVYEMPAVFVEKIFDMNTGNILVPEWYAST